MKTYPTRILPILVLALLILACQKQLTEGSVPPHEEDDPTTVSREMVVASIYGRVLDDAGLPLAAATVEAGELTTSTDEHGIFALRDVTISKQFGYVTVKKDGFFPGSRTVMTNSTSGNFVEIQLIKKDLKGSFNTAENASIKLDDNTIVSFPQDAIVDENGLTYSGKVNVYGAAISPSDADFSRTMPGDLRGLRSDSSVTALISYGMVTVNLETESGQKLQLGSAKSASIRKVIAPELMSKAPSSIPMWHFDEADGIWKEEGKAIKTGNSYEGMVSHFSTWNFDDPARSVLVSMKVVYENNTPVPYARVKISEDNGYIYNAGFTDSTGYVSIRAIKGVPLKLIIFDFESHTLVSRDLGVLNADLNIGEVTIDLDKAKVTVVGEVINCDEDSVANGTATLQLESLFYSARIVGGRFELPLQMDVGVGMKAEMVLTDEDRGISVVKNIELFAGVSDIGTVKVCEEVPVIQDSIEEYVKYTLGSDTAEFRPSVDSFYNEGSSLDKSWLFVAKGPAASQQDLIFNWNKSPNSMRFELMKKVPATYTDNRMQLIQMRHNGTLYASDDSTRYTVVKYGQVNEAIEFNFSGTVSDSIGNSLPISGEFRIRRRQ